MVTHTSRIAILLLAGLTTTATWNVALADGAAVDFTLSSTDADPAICREALETGKILRSDKTGTYIFSGYHLLRFTIAADRLSCTAMFVTNP